MGSGTVSIIVGAVAVRIRCSSVERDVDSFLEQRESYITHQCFTVNLKNIVVPEYLGNFVISPANCYSFVLSERHAINSN